MRTYAIEDLYPADAERITAALADQGLAGPIEGIFYLPVPEELYSDEQREHAPECGPYIMALELVKRAEQCELRLELLVRARGRLRCSCIAYATPAQRAQMMDFLDRFIRELDISV
ncbi:MAG: hypothetical protein AB7D57_12190 [Desulfovibrionaceae bacterium]